MDAHFGHILAPSSVGASKIPQITFIAAESFQGRKTGYKFQRGSKGVGYYYDRFQSSSSSDSAPLPVSSSSEQDDTGLDAKKRKRDEDSDTDANERSAKPSIEQLLENAEENGVVQLDSFSLKQLLLSFEKKITKNQKMRMKYPDEPEKFLDTELELHAEIQELYAVAASPELYPVLVQAGAVNSILGCLAHDNTDISIAAIGLLQEMTEPDTLNDNLDEAEELITALKDAQGLELIVQNLSRLNEQSEEDAAGVQQSLAIFENLVDIDPSIAVFACKKTHILKYLLERCCLKEYDANKLYSSEILSILLQADPSIPGLMCGLQDCDGMDMLLQCIALYRKKEVTLADEQECVENLFLSLSAALQFRLSQKRFLESEGVELMMRCLKEQQYAAGCAISVLNYAVLRNKEACARLVDVGGMKYIFPLLTGGGLKKALKKKGSGEKRNLEESALSIAAQLICWLGQDHASSEAYPARLLNKLVEKDHEKLERCAELYGKYSRMLDATDDEIELAREELQKQGDVEALQEFDDEDNIYARRLEGGLYNMQLASTILAYAAIYDPTCYKKAANRLSIENVSMEDVLTTLRDLLITLQEAEKAEIEVEEEGETIDSEENSVSAQYKQTIVQWCAALSKLVYSDSK